LDTLFTKASLPCNQPGRPIELQIECRTSRPGANPVRGVQCSRLDRFFPTASTRSHRGIAGCPSPWRRGKPWSRTQVSSFACADIAQPDERRATMGRAQCGKGEFAPRSSAERQLSYIRQLSLGDFCERKRALSQGIVDRRIAHQSRREHCHEARPKHRQ
jgi:hypothetical protein